MPALDNALWTRQGLALVAKANTDGDTEGPIIDNVRYSTDLTAGYTPTDRQAGMMGANVVKITDDQVPIRATSAGPNVKLPLLITTSPAIRTFEWGWFIGDVLAIIASGTQPVVKPLNDPLLISAGWSYENGVPTAPTIEIPELLPADVELAKAGTDQIRYINSLVLKTILDDDYLTKTEIANLIANISVQSDADVTRLAAAYLTSQLASNAEIYSAATSSKLITAGHVAVYEKGQVPATIPSHIAIVAEKE